MLRACAKSSLIVHQLLDARTNLPSVKLKARPLIVCFDLWYVQSEHAKVVRNGKSIPDLPARELVPGDIVELRVGDKVPADMRVVKLKTSTLRVEQSSLTGEAMAVTKTNHAIEMEDCELQVGQCFLTCGQATGHDGRAVDVILDISRVQRGTVKRGTNLPRWRLELKNVLRW